MNEIRLQFHNFFSTFTSIYSSKLHITNYPLSTLRSQQEASQNVLYALHPVK